jgi:hypothetical protein
MTAVAKLHTARRASTGQSTEAPGTLKSMQSCARQSSSSTAAVLRDESHDAEMPPAFPYMR